MRRGFQSTSMRVIMLALWVIVVMTLSQPAVANILCVNPDGSHGCYSKIQEAVDHASGNDVINVEAGTYQEEVDIGIPLSLIGAGPELAGIDATGLAHGIFVNGLDHQLNDVTVDGFTVRNALFEGILVVSASDVVIRNSRIVENDKSPGLLFTGDLAGCPDQPGNGVYETDETGDCGGALHLVGTVNATVDGNLITGNADGILISDETAESRGNLITHNTVKNNPLECGIVLASHPPSGHTSPPFAAHHGVDNNTVADNISADNGVEVGGAGVGLFSDGAGPGRVSRNVIIGNKLTGNGLGGVALHTHVGPAFGLPPDNMNGNMIVGNFIAANLADTGDTATAGPVGININSGSGGTPVRGTVISRNIIREEGMDIAINTPADVDLHLNDLPDGVINVCLLDGSICTGSIDATENWWGCPTGPGGPLRPPQPGYSSTDTARFTPWLTEPSGATIAAQGK